MFMYVSQCRYAFGLLVSVLGLMAVGSRPVWAQKAIRLEAETGQRTGVEVRTDGTGFSGSGYVSGLDQNGDQVTFTFPASAGLYEIRLRYRSVSGDKGCDISVNGARLSGMLTKSTDFTTLALGKTDLNSGTNTLTVEKGWGYYDLDAVELTLARPAPLPTRPPKRLIDPKATPAARALQARLVDLYGKRTLSGQTDFADADYVKEVTGKSPAILASDLMDYSPSRLEHGAKPQGHTERLIRAVKSDKYLLTLSWHWNAPTKLVNTLTTGSDGKEINRLWYRGFYTDATTFDVEKALANPQSQDYKLLLRDIDAIAVELKKAAKADVPILWRPLHEAEGRWFWWGAKGPEPFKKLWHLLYDRLTTKHGLHNLIWIFTSGNDPAWYPGDSYVDIVGVDAYPTDYTDALSGTWETMQKQYNGKKLVALTEFGKVPDVAKMHRYGVRWSYFASWTGDLGPKAIPRDELKRLYSQSVLVNRQR